MNEKVIYVPALGIFHFNLLQTERRNYKGYDLSFWNHNSIVKYSAVLMSAAYGMHSPNFKEDMKLGDDIFKIGDSGGFQIYTQNMKLDAGEVMKWLEKNFDMGFVLDIPGIVTNDKIEQTKKNIEKMLKFRTQGKKFELFNVLHGKDLISAQKYYNELKCFDNDLDGWACGGIKPASNLYLLALIQSFISRLSNRTHILGVSGFRSVPIIHYIARLYKSERTTFDSSSYLKLSINRCFLLDRLKLRTLNFGDKTSTTLEEMPCDCPVCEKLGNDFLQSIKDENNAPLDKTQICIYLTLHNLQVYTKYCDTIRKLSKDRDRLIDYTKFQFGQDIQEVFDFIDLCYDKGLEKGYDVYRENFVKFERLYKSQKIKQTNIFGFQ